MYNKEASKLTGGMIICYNALLTVVNEVEKLLVTHKWRFTNPCTRLKRGLNTNWYASIVVNIEITLKRLPELYITFITGKV